MKKIFTVEESHNSQNDRILAPSSKNIKDEDKFIDRVQKPQHLIVWAGVSASCRTNLIFVPQGVKINSEIYKELILELEIKGSGKKLFNNEEIIFHRIVPLLTPPMLPNRSYVHKILSLFRRKSGHLQVQILTHLTILYGEYCRQGLVQNHQVYQSLRHLTSSASYPPAFHQMVSKLLNLLSANYT